MSTSHKNFLSFFPVPVFLQMPAVGLDVSSEKITALELVSKNGVFGIGKFAEKILPPDTFVDGELFKKDSFIAALKQLRSELGLSFVSVSVSDEKIYVYETELPVTSYDEIRDILQFKLDENVPIAPDNAVFEFQIVKKDEQQNTMKVAVTVVPKDFIENYASVFVEAGLTPSSFYSKAEAVSRALIGQKEQEGTFALVHFGMQKTIISIVSNGVLVFASTIAIGSRTFTDSVMRAFSVDEAEALAIKRKSFFMNTPANLEFFSSITNVVSVLKDELNKMIGFWEERSGREGGEVISSVIMSGTDALIPGLADHISLECRKPVELGNIWSNVLSLDDTIPEILFEDSLALPIAIGLALPNAKMPFRK